MLLEGSAHLNSTDILILTHLILSRVNVLPTLSLLLYFVQFYKGCLFWL